MKHNISKIELMDLTAVPDANAAAESDTTIEKVSDIGVELIVRLGKAAITVGEAQKLKVGDVLEVEKNLGHKVDIYLGDTKIGIGEAVLIDDNFGIVISEMKRKKKQTNYE
ncbi:MAG: FliM/FliN family flagellar motor switch protein [Ectobacillus sp.]